jgi:RNA polymerase sigma-70 factor (ECF subfamily)
VVVDSDAVAALRAGDPDVFEAVVRDLTPGLVNLAKMDVSGALAEEIVQETWIYQIMLNKVRTLAVREAKIVPFAAMGPGYDGSGPAVDHDRLSQPDSGPGNWTNTPSRWEQLPADQPESKETLETIEAAIRRLPPSQREVVELRDVLGWTADEVCNTLGISSVNLSFPPLAGHVGYAAGVALVGL